MMTLSAGFELLSKETQKSAPVSMRSRTCSLSITIPGPLRFSTIYRLDRFSYGCSAISCCNDRYSCVNCRLNLASNTLSVFWNAAGLRDLECWSSAIAFAISANWFTISFVCATKCGWMYAGIRFNQIIHRTLSSLTYPARLRRCRKNWDGLRSPISSCSNRRRLFMLLR